MTGYGRGEARARNLTVVVELKSVNNRFRDINLRAPREYLALETRINALLKGPFTRGRIDAYVRRNAGASDSHVKADPALAAAYAKAVRTITEAVDDVDGQEVPLTFILSQPGVMTIAETPVDVMFEWDIVEIALQAAISDLLQMRESEGRALREDLGQQLARARQLVAEVEAASKGINERLRKKLSRRVQRLMTDQVDPYRLAQEVAYLADKADINEEIARLRSHCDQFASALEEDEPVGRRLDFLLQEMNREVNTVGSKAAEHPVSERVVLLKSVLERMREQSANVE
jgi:uncharacterized protein (TIGR00255 family)